MCIATEVRWTIIPLVAPRPWIVCGGCGTFKPFSSSGKVRLNANGKRLDAWMVYRCDSCAATWNRPLFERRLLREFDPATLDALHFSDPDWVRAREFDIDDLRRRAHRIEESAEIHIRKEVLNDAGPGALTVIELKVPVPSCLRLDRLLSMELGFARTKLQELQAEAKLQIVPDRRDALRRRVRDGSRVSWDQDNLIRRPLNAPALPRWPAISP
jgi:hypothetical protein